jgi:membrane-associated protease RseP (regulator of RpoE activity)
MAYDGQDVRREIAMNRLLQPGRTLRVRVRTRRENEVRDIPVKVAHVRDPEWREWAATVVVPRAVRQPRVPRSPAEPWTSVTPEPAPHIVGQPPVAAAPGITIIHVNGLAGAHVETITRGLADAIGVDRGVLVISVPPGAPAHEAGLVDGDVILKADGRDVHSVQELRKLVAANGDHVVRLDVARKGKVRQVTLRW